MPHEESKLERLKKLDLRVQMAGTIESLCFGIYKEIKNIKAI